MSIRGTSATTRAFKCAWNVECGASAAWRTTLVTLWNVSFSVHVAAGDVARRTLTFLMLQESHALRSLLVFCGCCESDDTSGWIGLGCG